MKSVSVIIILCTLPAGLGVIIDRLMLNRHKGRLHNALLRYWNHLDELSIPDIWRVFAVYTLRLFKRVFGKKILSFRCIITIIMVSFSLTFCVLSLIFSLEVDGFSFRHIFNKFFNSYGAVILVPHLFFINLIFDAATGLVTTKVLSVIHRSKPGKAIVLIVIDIILAFFFAAACLTYAFNASIFEHETVFENLFENIPINIYAILSNRVDHYRMLEFYLFAGTTFIPTLIYLSILVTLIISKAILEIVIRFTKHFFELATEVETSKDLKVFTLTGSLFSAIVILLTAFTKLCQTHQ